MEWDKLFNYISNIISEEQNRVLYQNISKGEVRAENFQLNPNKALGLDGFSMGFFQNFWDIMGNDPFLEAEESRSKMTMLGAINHTFLPLIPKKEGPQSMGDFRPITLCNTVHKVVTKIIANRIKEELNAVISKEQSGFALGRLIVEGIIIRNENLHSTKKERDAYMVIKLDILKAYVLVDR